jgi:hypothetical protein
LTGKTRALANEATVFALSRMVDGQPRCCKRASRKALAAAVQFLHDRMGINLNQGEKIRCTYPVRNRECTQEACSYYYLQLQ